MNSTVTRRSSRPSDAEEDRPAKRTKVDNVTSSNLEDAGIAEEEEEDAVVETGNAASGSDLYLDTVRVSIGYHAFECSPERQINRALLDFDFEKVCSVSLSDINVYGCLVCGKYFQGRGRKSQAFAHAIHDDHHVFINLETTRVCLMTTTFVSIASHELKGLRAS